MSEQYNANTQTVKKSPADPGKPVAHRKIKPGYIVAIVFLLFVQIAAIVFAVRYDSALDRIEYYGVDAVVGKDGTMTNTYTFRWKVLNDSREGPLTWVKIGMANTNYSVLAANGDADSVRSAGQYVEVYLGREFRKNEIAKFSFTVEQRSMFSVADGRYRIEFAPGWFPDIEVEEYRFTWVGPEPTEATSGGIWEGNELVYSGSLKKDGYRVMCLYYDRSSFSHDAMAVSYSPFHKISSESSSDNGGIVVFAVIVCVIALAFQVSLLNSTVLYYRGRGFYHVAVYTGGRGGGGHGGGGGGCACACACACAGGGRAGCSQKDTYSTFAKPQSGKTEPAETDNIPVSS